MTESERINSEKSWEVSWPTTKMRDEAKRWSLAGDNALVLNVKDVGHCMFSKIVEVEQLLIKSKSDIQSTAVVLDSICNDFQMLANQQFVENRVFEFDITVGIDELTPKVAAVNNGAAVDSKNKEERLSELLPHMKRALEMGLSILDTKYEKVQVTTDSDDSDADDSNTIKKYIEPIFQVRDPYESRCLPQLIGSYEWFQNDDVGIVESDDEVLQKYGFNSEEEEEENDGNDGDEEENVESDEKTANNKLQSNLYSTSSNSDSEYETSDTFDNKPPHRSAKFDSDSDDNSNKNNKPVLNFNSELQRHLTNKKYDSQVVHAEPSNNFFNSESDEENVFKSNDLFGSLVSKKKTNLFDDEDNADEAIVPNKPGSKVESKARSNEEPSRNKSILTDLKAEKTVSSRHHNVSFVASDGEDDLFKSMNNKGDVSEKKNISSLSGAKAQPLLSQFSSDDDDLFAIPNAKAEQRNSATRVTSAKTKKPAFSNNNIGNGDEDSDSDLFSTFKPALTKPGAMSLLSNSSDIKSELKKKVIDQKSYVPTDVFDENEDSDNDLFSTLNSASKKSKIGNSNTVNNAQNKSFTVDKSDKMKKVDNNRYDITDMFEEDDDSDLFSTLKSPKKSAVIIENSSSIINTPNKIVTEYESKNKNKVDPKSREFTDTIEEDDNDSLFSTIKPALTRPSGGVSIFGNASGINNALKKSFFEDESDKYSKNDQKTIKKVSDLTDEEDDEDLFSITKPAPSKPSGGVSISVNSSTGIDNSLSTPFLEDESGNKKKADSKLSNTSDMNEEADDFFSTIKPTPTKPSGGVSIFGNSSGINNALKKSFLEDKSERKSKNDQKTITKVTDLTDEEDDEDLFSIRKPAPSRPSEGVSIFGNSSTGIDNSLSTSFVEDESGNKKKADVIEEVDDLFLTIKPAPTRPSGGVSIFGNSSGINDALKKTFLDDESENKKKSDPKSINKPNLIDKDDEDDLFSIPKPAQITPAGLPNTVSSTGIDNSLSASFVEDESGNNKKADQKSSNSSDVIEEVDDLFLTIKPAPTRPSGGVSIFGNLSGINNALKKTFLEDESEKNKNEKAVKKQSNLIDEDDDDNLFLTIKPAQTRPSGGVSIFGNSSGINNVLNKSFAEDESGKMKKANQKSSNTLEVVDKDDGKYLFSTQKVNELHPTMSNVIENSDGAGKSVVHNTNSATLFDNNDLSSLANVNFLTSATKARPRVTNRRPPSKSNTNKKSPTNAVANKAQVSNIVTDVKSSARLEDNVFSSDSVSEKEKTLNVDNTAVDNDDDLFSDSIMDALVTHTNVKSEKLKLETEKVLLSTANICTNLESSMPAIKAEVKTKKIISNDKLTDDLDDIFANIDATRSKTAAPKKKAVSQKSKKVAKPVTKRDIDDIFDDPMNALGGN